MGVYTAFIIGGLFFSLITGIILFFKSGSCFRKQLLAIVQFVIAWYAFSYLLVLSKLIVEVPLLYRVGCPFYYLVPPLIYFYCRSVLKNENKFRKWDFLHFLPVILTTIDLLPYYVMSPELKQQHVNAIASDPNLCYHIDSGYLPSVSHFLLRPVHAMCYMFFLWRLAFQAYRSSQQNTAENKTTWVYWCIGIFSLIYLALAAATFRGYANLEGSSDMLAEQSTLIIAITAAFFCFSVSLFFWPNILYDLGRGQNLRGQSAEGISDRIQDTGFVSDEHLRPGSVDNINNSPEEEQALISEKLLSQYVASLENLIEVKEMYRNQKLSINELSLKLGIAPKTLSYVINRHYQQRFSDFVNGYRIQYIIRRFEADDWRGLSLEGLSLDAGFSSRTTFFSAFKKHTGCTPSEFLSRMSVSSVAC